MKPKTPRLSGHMLRTMVRTIESPVIGGGAFYAMAHQMGVRELLDLHVPRETPIPFDHAPIVASKRNEP